MAIPVIIAENQTAGALFLSRLGLTVPASGQITLTDFSWEHEIREDEDLQAGVLAGNILLNFGQGALTAGESLKFFNLVTLEVRIPVRALADANVAALSGTMTIDAVSLVADDRVLLTAQSTATENGPWVVKAGAWVRPDDFGTGQSASMAIVAVDEGTTYGDQVWHCTTNLGSDVIGTNNLAFQQISGSGGATSLQAAYDGGNTIVTAGAVDIDFTLTSGDFVVDGPGDILFGAGAALGDFTVDTATMSLDSTDTTNLTMTANVAADRTLTISATNSNAGGDGILDIASDGFMNLDGDGGVIINSSGGNIDIGTDADTGAIDIGTAGSVRDITVGNQTGATSVIVNSGTGGTDINSTGVVTIDAVGNSNFTTDSGNLTFQTTTSGRILLDSVGEAEMQGATGAIINSSGGNISIGTDADDGDINIGTATTAGRDITIGNKTGTTGVTIEATQTGQVLIDSPNTRLTGNLVVDGTSTTIHSEEVNISDNNLYLNADYTTVSGLAGGFTVNYLPTATNDTVAAGGFTAGVAAVSNPTVATTAAAAFAVGDIIQVSGAADQANDGVYEVLTSAANVLTITGIGLTGTTYDFLSNDFITDTTVQGTITKINVGVTQVDATGNLQYGSGSDTTSLTFQDVIDAGTLTLQAAYDGGNTITTAGGVDVVIAGTDGLQVTGAGGLDVDTIADFDVTTFDVLMTGTNGFSIDGTAASNIGVDAGNLTLATTTSGEVLIDGIDGVEINSSGGAIDIGNDADAQAINVGTGAAARDIAIGNNTGATGVTIDSGSEQVEIDGVTYYGNSSGAPTPTASGFQDGDKYYDTGIDAEMRYDGTRAKWLSVEAMYVQFGRNGNTAAAQYYRAIDGRVMSSALGYRAPYAGTIVGMGYTRADVDAATFEIVEGGVNRETLATAAVAGGDNAMDGDFSQNGILAVRNATGGNTVSDVVAWFKVKWRTA